MSENTAVKNRCDIPAEYKWRLEDIYANDGLWEEEYEKLSAMIPALEELRHTLTAGGKQLAEGLKKMDEAAFLLERLYVYARMRRDEDNTNAAYQALTDRATSLSVRLSAATAYVSPLLLSMDEATLKEYVETTPELGEYRFMIADLLRGKKHILSEQEEKLLSLAGDFSGGAKDIFTMLNNADIRFADVEKDGTVHPLSHATYIALMQDGDRALREKVFETYYKSFKDQINTISATYATSVKKDVFYAKARGYGSALEKGLFADNVPVSVYDGLIETIHKNLPILHRYVALRKELLGVEKLHMYDIYAPLVSEAHNTYTYEEAVHLCKEGLKPLGEDYCAVLESAFEEGWVDVYENKGKSSGAYSWGVYGTHPYVLLNHRGDLDSVFTIAHEMGHAMHTYYSNKMQPYSTSGYAIFVAEVASTVNEILMTRYLLKTVTDKKLRKYILNHYIDQFRTTVLRQTMFAEFEKESHAMAEAGQPLTAASLCEVYGKLNKLYHGPAMEEDETISYEWARIPHFYNAFYVYKYATGFSCASAIVANLDKPGFLEKYRAFLGSGGSDYPIALLETAGVDFKSVVDTCMAEFDRALGEFEALCREDL
ncbi:MAG: oligoendopeptidase F [Christensenellaceae bacterium]|nr:oligoendopeptidase F [Christensenellaceae bacterium]